MALNWADKRRALLLTGVGVVFVLIVAATLIAVMYETPSCMDAKQNQDETGIDCGGSCMYLCVSDTDEPRVNFVRPLQNGAGRADVIAYVENRNISAQVKGARFTVELYGADNLLLAQKEGVLDLPARSIVPIFLPGLYQGTGIASRAFISFDEPLRFSRATDGAAALLVENVALLPGAQPRVTANLRNSSARPFYNVRVIATIFNAEGTAIAASQTVVREVPALGTAAAVFTWSEPFAGEPARVEVLQVPLIP